MWKQNQRETDRFHKTVMLLTLKTITSHERHKNKAEVNYWVLWSIALNKKYSWGRLECHFQISSNKTVAIAVLNRFWHNVGTKWKVRGSLKSSLIFLWGIWMSAQNFMANHRTVVDIWVWARVTNSSAILRARLLAWLNNIDISSFKQKFPKMKPLSLYQPEDGAKVFKEQPAWQEISCVQDDGREQKEEESISTESWGSRVTNTIDHPSNQEAHHNEETALWDHCWDSTWPVETWRVETEKIRGHHADWIQQCCDFFSSKNFYFITVAESPNVELHYTKSWYTSYIYI